jgi:hypothetical protein
MKTQNPKAWTRAIPGPGVSVRGYSVHRDEGGREIEVARYLIRKHGWRVAFYLANKHRDDLNAGIA